MTLKPRTIDNMGIETSSRYARDQATLDTKMIEESRFIGSKVESSALTPYLATDFEQYIGPNKLIIWASFLPPPDYFAHATPLFTFQLIPSLGGYEKQEADSDKVEALGDALSKEGKKKGGKQDEQKQKEEIQVMLKLLQTIGKLERTLEMINSRRNQYQRG